MSNKLKIAVKYEACYNKLLGGFGNDEELRCAMMGIWRNGFIAHFDEDGSIAYITIAR